MNPLKFSGSKVTKDPKNFVKELQKVFKVMRVADAKHVELALYNLKVERQGRVKNKRAKTSNHDSDQQKTRNVNRSSFQQRSPGRAPSSANAPAPKNINDFRNKNSQNFRAWPT
uniref:Polyprotein n=1 Tax=Solanum tuberosum TaxID=4113 RepID=M1DK58_SOLTU